MGKWFGVDHYGIENVDFMVLAKGLSSGYTPIGAIIVSDRVLDSVRELSAERDFMFGHTNSGHPVSCSIALENIRILNDEHILEHVSSTLAPGLAAEIGRLSDHPLVGEARSDGFVGAIEIVKNKFPKGTVGPRLRDYGLRHGVIFRPRDETIIMLPPLVMTRDQLGELIGGLRLALDDLYKDLRVEGQI
jgi:putrescine aminotransferase